MALSEQLDHLDTCRRRFPPGRRLLLSLRVNGAGRSVSGRLRLHSLEGVVDGTVDGNVLRLSGTLADQQIRLTITSWNTRIDGDQMSGTFTFRVRPRVLPGTARATASVRVLGRVSG